MNWRMIGVKLLYSRPLVSEQSQELGHSVILIHLEQVKGNTGRENMSSLLIAERKIRTFILVVCFAETPIPAVTSRWAPAASWCQSRLASLWAAAQCWPALYLWSFPTATKKWRKVGIMNTTFKMKAYIWDFKAAQVCAWIWALENGWTIMNNLSHSSTLSESIFTLK